MATAANALAIGSIGLQIPAWKKFDLVKPSKPISAQARWRAAESVSHDALSSHRSEAFGRDYGVLLREWRLLQRAVFVIDPNGRIRHAEYVADQMAEPNYDAAIAAARAGA